MAYLPIEARPYKVREYHEWYNVETGPFTYYEAYMHLTSKDCAGVIVDTRDNGEAFELSSEEAVMGFLGTDFKVMLSKMHTGDKWHAVMTIGEFGANALTEDSAKRIYNDLRDLLPEHLAKGTYRIAIFDAANNEMLKADIVTKSL